MKKKTARGAKAKKTTRKRSRVVVRKRTPKRTTKRTTKRKPPTRKRRRTPPPTAEYSVNISYRKQSKPQSAISFQMSVTGPVGLSKDEVIDAVTQVIVSEGEDVPKGFKVRIVSWKGGAVPHEVPWGSLAIIAGEPVTRFRVQ